MTRRKNSPDGVVPPTPSAPQPPADPLYLFRRGSEPPCERANEHVRREPPAPIPGVLRYSWFLRGLKSEPEPDK